MGCDSTSNSWALMKKLVHIYLWLQQRLPALMLASLACANSMCKMALPTSVYATYTRAVSPLRMKDAAGTPEVPAPVLHRGRLRQPPKRQ